MANEPEEPPLTDEQAAAVARDASRVHVDDGQAAGRTRISEAAVAKVAAIAARSVTGVNALGSGSTRALGAIRGAVGAENLAAGVAVEVGEAQVAVDINLIADYGYPLQTVANQVRASVFEAVEKLVGLQVIEVNIEINDVHIPGTGAPNQQRAPEKKEPRD